MRPELAAIVDWLRASGRMAEVDYGRLLYEIVVIGWRAAIAAGGYGDVEELTSAARASAPGIQTTSCTGTFSSPFLGTGTVTLQALLTPRGS
jgi:hypothetical protein